MIRVEMTEEELAALVVIGLFLRRPEVRDSVVLESKHQCDEYVLTTDQLYSIMNNMLDAGCLEKTSVDLGHGCYFDLFKSAFGKVKKDD